MSETYRLARRFKRRYPFTVAWRLRSHSKIIDMHLNPDEKILYLFLGQKNDGMFDFVNTNIIALTNKRIMIATKRVLFGYFFISITPEMYNDFTIRKSILWGNIIIDTIKEKCYFSNIDPRALPEIETNITEIMAKAQRECEVNPKRNKGISETVSEKE